MLLLSLTAEAQTPFNGRIRNLDGSGVKATVRVKDSDKVTRSDGKGRFGLTDVKDDDILEIVIKILLISSKNYKYLVLQVRRFL